MASSTRSLHTSSERRKTTLWLDPRKLDRARRVLGTRGIRDTIDGALDEVVAIATRRRLVERLREMKGIDLDDEKLMSGAWR
ncbi:MAG: type II toxin-antitoxin system VapB family antitoxin [Deltaproteobacteria bacterium]|nr:type II toxin-antitoxin system VapB family antitoxin [Deltaproteobacteria bacterium]